MAKTKLGDLDMKKKMMVNKQSPSCGNCGNCPECSPEAEDPNAAPEGELEIDLKGKALADLLKGVQARLKKK